MDDSLLDDSLLDAPFAIQKHQPERRRQPGVSTLACGCCCCCCCCLHTIGSIVGASIAPTIGRGRMAIYYYYDEETGEAVPALSKAGISAIALFWWLVLGMTLLGLFGSALGGPEGLLIGGVIIALALPIVQIVSAIITAIVMAASSRYDKMYQLKQLGKVTLGVVIGTVLGIVMMVGIGVGLSLMQR